MMDWNYAVRTPTAIISLAETYEDAEKAIEVLVNDYGLERDDLEIVKYGFHSVEFVELRNVEVKELLV